MGNAVKPSPTNQFLRDFKVLILDADGVIFTGDELITPAGNPTKIRSFQDGQGLSFLRAIGIRILIVTAETGAITDLVTRWNLLPSVKQTEWDRVELLKGRTSEAKKEVIDEWLHYRGFFWESCVYIGDDINDYWGMKAAGLVVAPANATRRIKDIADLILEHDGGRGAIREFAERVLDVREIDERDLPVC